MSARNAAAQTAGRTGLARALPWLLAGAYLALRMTNLAHLPMFADEGTYLWWGEQLLRGDLLRGFGQGKPLVGWLMALALASGLEPIAAARGMGVLAGGLGLLSTAWLAQRAFSPRAGLLAAGLWVLLPYNLIFERVVTPDQMLGSLGAAALAASVLALEPGRRWWTAAAAGGLWVTAALAKMPVGLFLFAAPLALWVLTPAARRPATRQMMWVYALPGLFTAGAVLAAGYRLGSGQAPIGFGFDELLLKTGSGSADPGANALAVLGWLGRYLTWPGAALLAVGWVGAWRRGQPLARLAALLTAGWLAVFVPVADYWVPRYLLPVLPLTVLLMAWAGDSALRAVARRWRPRQAWTSPLLYAATCVLVAAAAAPLTSAVILAPARAPWAAEDRTAFVEGYGGGYGLEEAAAYLNGRLADDPTSEVIAMDIKDDKRLRLYMAPAQAGRVRQMHIVDGQNQAPPQMIARVQAALRPGAVTYLLMGSREQWTADWQAALPQAVLERAIEKPGGRDAVLLFRLTKDP